MIERAPVWSAPVRYVEVDGQGVVFNAHYLTWCDEALGAWARGAGLGDLAERVQLKTSTLTWTGPLRHGDTVEVGVACEAIGRTSLTLRFDVRGGGAPACEVRTVYVLVDHEGRPEPLPDHVRERLALRHDGDQQPDED